MADPNALKPVGTLGNLPWSDEHHPSVGEPHSIFRHRPDLCHILDLFLIARQHYPYRLSRRPTGSTFDARGKIDSSGQSIVMSHILNHGLRRDRNQRPILRLLNMIWGEADRLKQSTIVRDSGIRVFDELALLSPLQSLEVTRIRPLRFSKGIQPMEMTDGVHVFFDTNRLINSPFFLACA